MKQINHTYLKLENFKGLPFDHNTLIKSVDHLYQILDTIDNTLVSSNSDRLSTLVEKANLSSIVGNILGAGFAINSKGKYYQNGPHTYPDLINKSDKEQNIEIKVALQKNYPKGHLPKKGNYLTFRYILDSKGSITIWEIKYGFLNENSFNISNTEGDSGKTAVISANSFNNMTLLYLDNTVNPYTRYPGA